MPISAEIYVYAFDNNNNNDFILVSMYLAEQLANWGHFPMFILAH